MKDRFEKPKQQKTRERQTDFVAQRFDEILIIATSHDLGPQEVAFRKASPLIFYKKI